jgi:hypothetical protein
MRLAILLLAGCATAESVGVQGVTMLDHDHSVEGTLAGGVGLGDPDDAFLWTAAVARGGGESHLEFGGEWVTLGDRGGWQVGGAIGGAWGAYQDNDTTLQLTGGHHWNLSRKEIDGGVRVVSVSLDGKLGYALRSSQDAILPSGDGAFAGVGLSLRRDRVHSFRGPH